MKTVLIIEDDDNNLVLISDLLEMAGYRVVAARSGAAGLELALAGQADLVILDVGLPDMPGTEVLRAIRDSGIDGELPIIAMTSFAMSGDRERLLAIGCSGYIEKPIDPTRVIRQIETVLGSESRGGEDENPGGRRPS